jgi:hypothetical protein
MYPHRIRLRGPWEAEPLDPPGPLRRVTLPARLGECGLGDCRRVRFRRRFGRPRRIDSHERVWLIGEGLTGRAAFQVNGRRLGSHGGDAGPFAFRVTEFLGERNELTVELESSDAAGGLWGDVALEVRCAAYLSDVRATPVGGRLRVTGNVAGEADGRLEVYVLAGGRCVGYARCSAAAKFEVLTEDLSNAPPDVRVELINCAMIWYAVDVRIV